MANNSIFELADKFGYTSPFGDWLPEKQQPPTTKITDIQVSKGNSRYIKANNAMAPIAQQLVTPIIIAITVGL